METLTKLLKGNAKLQTIGGIAMSLIGLLSITMPYISGLTIASLISLAIVATGLTTSIFAFSKDKWQLKLLSFISGLLITIFGAVMFITPSASLYTLAILAVSYFIVDGLHSVFCAYHARKGNGWGWMLFNAVISLGLAVLLISQWPLSSFYIVGTLVGARFIFSGFYLVLFATTGYNVITTIEKELTQHSTKEKATQINSQENDNATTEQALA